MFHVPNEFRLKKHPILGSDDSYGNNGFFIFNYKGYEVRCQASEGLGWRHVSVTINRNRTPSWEIMNYVKDLFWDAEDCVVQFHPPKSEYVNNHENCLHLWQPIDQEIPLPDSIMVGYKQLRTNHFAKK